jgi:hypothetical protein
MISLVENQLIDNFFDKKKVFLHFLLLFCFVVSSFIGHPFPFPRVYFHFLRCFALNYLLFVDT